MGQLARFSYSMRVTGAVIIMAILYFRIAIEYFDPMVNGTWKGVFETGPLTSVANLAFWAVPVALSVILIATWGWFLIAPQQEERARARRRP